MKECNSKEKKFAILKEKNEKNMNFERMVFDETTYPALILWHFKCDITVHNIKRVGDQKIPNVKYRNAEFFPRSDIKKPVVLQILNPIYLLKVINSEPCSLIVQDSL